MQRKTNKHKHHKKIYIDYKSFLQNKNQQSSKKLFVYDFDILPERSIDDRKEFVKSSGIE